MQKTNRDLQTALNKLVGPTELLSVCSIGGGCISDAFRVNVVSKDGPRSLFVKSNDLSFLDNFQPEWLGLQQLGDTQVIRVPTPLAVGSAAGKSWLVLQWVDQGSQPSDFYETFGRRLAQMHHDTNGSKIGADQDNYLGAAIQKNTRTTCWPTFVAEHRLGFQLRWSVDQGYCDSQLRQNCEAIIDQVTQLLSGRDHTTSLLHGDLWSGNYLCDTDGEVVLIDPAAYRGCREAEFGMLKLFGACPPQFYEAYQSTWPMPDGWQRRSDIYMLYHLLNHLNLFGSGYLSQCKSLSAAILKH